MRASSIAVVTVAFAIAACTKDATAPTATDPGQALMAQMSGGTHSSSTSSSQNQPKFGKDDHDKNKAGHDDDDRNKCGDKAEDKDKHDGHGDDHWSKRGGDDDREECCEDDHDREEGHDHHDWGKGGHDGHEGDKRDHDDDDQGKTGCTAEIHGVKFNDLNSNAVRDPGEPGISGWTIHLTGSGVAQDATTGTDGSYSFTNLQPGTYTVCEVQQQGFVQTFPTTGADCTPGLGYNLTLSAGQSATGIDFGNAAVPTTGTIRGTVMNFDFTTSSSTGAISYPVYLLNATGYAADGSGAPPTFNMSTSTPPADATGRSTGSYSFTVPAGTYLVCEADPGPIVPSPFPTLLTPEGSPLLGGGLPGAAKCPALTMPDGHVLAPGGYLLTVPDANGNSNLVGENFINGFGVS